MAAKFIENKYDLRWRHRTIAGSRTYELSSAAPIAAAHAIQLTNDTKWAGGRLSF
jgi:hypothetical protein